MVAILEIAIFFKLKNLLILSGVIIYFVLVWFFVKLISKGDDEILDDNDL